MFLLRHCLNQTKPWPLAMHCHPAVRAVGPKDASGVPQKEILSQSTCKDCKIVFFLKRYIISWGVTNPLAQNMVPCTVSQLLIDQAGKSTFYKFNVMLHHVTLQEKYWIYLLASSHSNGPCQSLMDGTNKIMFEIHTSPTRSSFSFERLKHQPQPPIQNHWPIFLCISW